MERGTAKQTDVWMADPFLPKSFDWSCFPLISIYQSISFHMFPSCWNKPSVFFPGFNLLIYEPRIFIRPLERDRHGRKTHCLGYVVWICQGNDVWFSNMLVFYEGIHVWQSLKNNQRKRWKKNVHMSYVSTVFWHMSMPVCFLPLCLLFFVQFMDGFWLLF